MDPSCSGSGTVVSRMDHLLPQPSPQAAGGEGGGEEGGNEDGSGRVEQLARFQVGGGTGRGGGFWKVGGHKKGAGGAAVVSRMDRLLPQPSSKRQGAARAMGRTVWTVLTG